MIVTRLDGVLFICQHSSDLTCTRQEMWIECVCTLVLKSKMMLRMKQMCRVFSSTITLVQIREGVSFGQLQ